MMSMFSLVLPLLLVIVAAAPDRPKRAVHGDAQERLGAGDQDVGRGSGVGPYVLRGELRYSM